MYLLEWNFRYKFLHHFNQSQFSKTQFAHTQTLNHNRFLSPKNNLQFADRLNRCGFYSFIIIVQLKRIYEKKNIYQHFANMTCFTDDVQGTETNETDVIFDGFPASIRDDCGT